MTKATIDRVAILEEAQAIEKAGGDWDVVQAATVLGVARSTLYTIPFIMRRAVYPLGKGKGRPVRIPPAVVRLHQAQNTGAALARAGGDR